MSSIESANPTLPPAQPEGAAGVSGRPDHRPSGTDPLLQVADLRVSFRDEAGGWRETLHGVNFAVAAARSVALVGESGSGKSVSSLAVMGLLPARVSRIEPGSVLRFAGQDLLALPAQQRRALRGAQIAMVFQEPMSSLNPVFRVGEQIAEVLRLHQGLSAAQALERARGLLDEVGLPDPGRRLRAYPHQLSGGQQQRVMIAMAIACEPQLLIADEPTTALDVTIQRQILELLAELRARRSMAMLFITHDLGVVSDIADDVVVMRHGVIREQGPAAQVLGAPKDAYTRALLACRPPLVGRPARLLQVEDFMGAVEPGPAPGVASVIADASCNAHTAAATATTAAATPLLVVEGLGKVFSTRQGLFGQHHFTALQDVSFTLPRGKTLGVVGESGCGKTTLGLTLMRLHLPTSGRVMFDGADLSTLSDQGWQAMRRRIQIVFQNPYASLNPRFTVAEILTEPMLVHGIGMDAADRRRRAAALLDQVGLPGAALLRYPHEFSGGQRQRIAIARCLALEPELLILDESVSALDVSVQAQVINLLRDLQARLGLSYVFISHDLAVVRYLSDRVLVMQSGQVVEEGSADQLFDGGQHHPYTERLLAAIPGRGGATQRAG